ncbi:MAG: phosphotransferase [Patescibacteria group bacterium]
MIRWKPIPPTLLNHVSRVAEQEFGIRDITTIRQVDEWEQMSNNFRLTARGGTFLVRKNIVATLSRIEASTSILQYLHNAGVAVPQLISAIDGRHCVEYEDSYWQVFGFISGNHFRGTLEELIQAAKAVAKMHSALASFPEPRRIPNADAVMPLEFDTQTVMSSFRGENQFERTLIGQKDFLENTIRYIREVVADLGRMRQQALHGDIHPQNFLFHNSACAAIIDFGNSFFGPLMDDVAMACHRLTRQYVVHQKKRPWPKTLSPGLRSFLEAYMTIHPLSDEELGFLPVFMTDLLFRKLLNNIRTYIQGKRTAEIAYTQHQRFVNFMDEIHAVETELYSFGL